MPARSAPRTIARVQEGTVSRPTIADLIGTTADLATLPSTVIALLDVLKEPSSGAADVEAVLERDPAMTANVLKLANSAFYGARRSIGTVRGALVMLGNRTVATLAFATGMAPVLRRDLDGYGTSRDAFWRHSLLAAAAAAWAADLVGLEDWRHECFTAGMIHDVGMLVIDRWLVENELTLPGPGDEAAGRAAERTLLGFDHAEAGGALAEAWGFPEHLVTALRCHHAPDLAGDLARFTAAVSAGDVVAGVLAGDDPGAPPPDAAMGEGWPATAVADLASLGFFANDFDDLRLDLAGDLDQTLAAATRPAGCPV
jgi:HD-like signal output (HDOD) protein